MKRRGKIIPGMIRICEAAAYAHITPQAIYAAIAKDRLEAFRVGKIWYIKKADFDAYRLSKYCRDLSKDKNGALIFDMEKGEFSVQQVAKIVASEVGIPYNIYRIYYLLKRGELRASRKGNAWVIPKAEAQRLLEDVQRKKRMAV